LLAVQMVLDQFISKLRKCKLSLNNGAQPALAADPRFETEQVPELHGNLFTLAGAGPRFAFIPAHEPGPSRDAPRGQASARGQGAWCLRWYVLYTEPT
jgi:hypothetical protein